MVPPDLLHEVDLARDVAAPGGDVDHPGVARIAHREAEAGEDAPALRGGHGRAQDGRDAAGPQGDAGAGPRRHVAVDQPRPRGARPDLRREVGDPGQGHGRPLGIGAALEAVRGLGVHAQGLGRAADGGRIPVRRLQGHRARRLRDLALGAAHDAGQGQRPLRAAHHAHAPLESPLFPVEGHQPLAGTAPAHDHARVGHLGQVEGVRGMAHLHHHVVGEVDHVVDGAHADLLQPLAQPGGRGSHAHVEDAAGEARAQLGRLHLDRPRRRGRGPALRDIDRERTQRRAVEDGDLARHAVDVHAVHTVGGDVEVEDGLVALAFHPVHGQAGQGEVVGQTGRLHRDLHELAQPPQGHLHPGNCSRKRRSLS